MLNIRPSVERGIPLWAFGAPLVGVPIMVALLAIATPRAAGFEEQTTIEVLQIQELAEASTTAHDCTLRPNDS
jgi:hypothetical protein